MAGPNRIGKYSGATMLTDNPAMVVIAGTFQLNSTSDPDVTVGNGWTVARSATGKFTVTLNETLSGLYALTATAGLATAASGQHRHVHFDPIDLTTTVSSFVLYHSVAGTDTDTDNAQVSFIACFRKTTLTK